MNADTGEDFIYSCSEDMAFKVKLCMALQYLWKDSAFWIGNFPVGVPWT